MMEFFLRDIFIWCFIISASVQGSQDCPPMPNDCDPECIVQLPHCRKCDCDEASNYGGMSFQSMGSAGKGSGGGSPFNQGQDLSRTPFSSSIDALGTSMTGSGLGEVSGIGMGGMRNGLMSVPGMFLHGPSTSRHRSCLRGDMICPTYCLVIDEYGCKTCPCGPANGMGVPMVAKNSHHEKEKSNCMATLLCMLSCKDGYKLGPKDKDGCNTCECTKKKSNEDKNKDSKKENDQGQGQGQGNNGTSNGNGSGNGENGPFGTGFNPMFAGTSMGSSMGGMMAGGDGSGCSGPFCGGGKGMKSPFESPGGSGKDDHCLGPECSAPGKHNPGNPATLNVPAFCQTTDLCAKSCKYTVKLGPKMADGCPSCACEKSEVSTTAAPQKQKICQQVVDCIMNCKEGYKLKSALEGECPLCECNAPRESTQTVSKTPKSPGCTEQTLGCMKSCRHGYHMQSSPIQECPICSCLPPPTVAPSRGVYAVLHECPDTVHCMTSCTNGYSLDGGATHCPSCTCNEEPMTTLTCTAALSCPRGCQLGYKGGADGCPTCSCVAAKEIGVSHAMTHIQTSITCGSVFSCSSQCEFGYKTGNNGCPICKCLQPLAGIVQVSVQDKCPESAQCSKICPNGFRFAPVLGQECPACECAQLVPATQAPPAVLKTLAPPLLTCTGMQCSHMTKGSTHPVTMRERCPETFQCDSVCEHGFSLRTVSGSECPVCECAVPVKVPVHTEKIVQIVKPTVVTETSKPVIVAPAVATHSNQGSVGNPVTGDGGLAGPTATGSENVGLLPSEGRIPHVTNVVSNHQALLGSAVQGGGGGGGETCIGPACSAKNGFHLGFNNKKTLNENQCAVILTCVVSCHHGYKLGPRGEDGCPTCKCLK